MKRNERVSRPLYLTPVAWPLYVAPIASALAYLHAPEKGFDAAMVAVYKGLTVSIGHSALNCLYYFVYEEIYEKRFKSTKPEADEKYKYYEEE